ncbi:uncharacterized protein LOC131647843 [Vicia villosa]|uniref:uncharacterized protein LOC131647843 n=1 Tax=Vicia villosa TaxID=3911 RepID=UPI00273B18EC|nr:uncharacterized protein LOC131647843 [Vicia villosa]
MAKRFHLLVQYKELVKNFQSTTIPKAAIVSHFSIAKQSHYLHTQGGDSLVGAENQGSEKASETIGNVEETIGKESVETAWDATKKTVPLVTDTTTAEADMNVMDTVEYRSREGLVGQLGDGCDNVRF